MSYTLGGQLAPMMTAAQGQVPDGVPLHWFALADVAQIKGLDRKLKALVGDATVHRLYEETLAHSALDISPVLLALSDDPATRLDQCRALDAACQSRPALSILQSRATLMIVLQHLKGLLRITADGTDYLWRFADTQMLQATHGVLTPSQQRQVLGPLSAWCFANHAGVLIHLAAHGPDVESAALGLELDGIQTDQMLAACAGPMLASQLRALEPRFAALSHAQQSTFAHDCVVQAEVEGIDPDRELPSWALDRWLAAKA
jgi:Domain of unknown function (DUF4123)